MCVALTALIRIEALRGWTEWKDLRKENPEPLGLRNHAHDPVPPYPPNGSTFTCMAGAKRWPCQVQRVVGHARNDVLARHSGRGQIKHIADRISRAITASQRQKSPLAVFPIE